MASRVDNDQTLRNFVGYYPAGPAVEAVKSALTELEQLRTSVAGLRDYVDSGVSDNELVIQLQGDLRCLRKAARELAEALPEASDIPEMENNWAQGGDDYRVPWSGALAHLLSLLVGEVG